VVAATVCEHSDGDDQEFIKLEKLWRKLMKKHLALSISEILLSSNALRESQ
jgi:hypothetical protein